MNKTSWVYRGAVKFRFLKKKRGLINRGLNVGIIDVYCWRRE